MKVLGCTLIAALFVCLPTIPALAGAGEVTKTALEPPSEPVVVPKPVSARDPFRPYTFNLHPQQLAHAQLTPLQRYDTGQLTVAATIWDVSPPRAMLQDSVGMGYIVTLGTLIGPNGGLVTAIEPQRVIVEERVLDFYGKEQVNRIVMETPKEESANEPREQK